MVSNKVYKNGKIYTVNDDMKWAEAVAIKDKKIIYVGTNKGAEKYIGEETEVVDLKGKMMMPGFVESHSHPMAYLTEVTGVDVTECTTIEEYQKKIKDYADENPDRKVIMGIGWFAEDFDEEGAKKEYLDEVVSDRPVCIYSGCLFNFWVNSKLLEVARIDKNTPDIEKGGKIVRDKEGNPTGVIEELGGQYLVQDRMELFSKEDYEETVKYYQSLCNSLGIIAVHDAAISEPEYTLNAYLSLAKKNELTVRMRKNMMARELPGTPNLNDALEILKKEHKRNYGDIVQSNTIKIMSDGIIETSSAAIEEPYVGTDNCGEFLYDIDEFKEFCREVDKEGLQLRIHTTGDRSARYALDALEYAEKMNGKRDSRHILAHVQFISESDIDRMARLGVAADLNVLWNVKSSLWDQFAEVLGKERAMEVFKVKSFMDKGVVVSTGTDAPVLYPFQKEYTDVHPFSPFLAMQIGVTRHNVGESEENVLIPEERVTLEEMIKVTTINGAYSIFTDDVSGSIEVGKYADMIVIDQNIFEVPVEEIYKTKVLLTVFEGKEVYKNKM